MHRTSLPILLLLLGPVVVACSGNEPTGPTGPTEPTSVAASPSEAPAETAAPADTDAAAPAKEDFVAQANQICEAANEDLQAAADEYPEDATSEQLLQFSVEEILPGLQQQHDEIAELGVPVGDEAEVQAILDGLQAGIDAANADPVLLQRNDSLLIDAGRLASAYGLTACGP